MSQFFLSLGSEKTFSFLKFAETVARFPFFLKIIFIEFSAIQDFNFFFFKLIKFIFAPTLSENTSLHFTLFIFRSELAEWSLYIPFHALKSCDDFCMKSN